MPEFLEEVLPVNVRMGSSYGDGYEVQVTTTAGGLEYRKLIHRYPVRSFTINYTQLREDLAADVLALYHRAYGMYAGFRVHCVDDYSTNNHVDVPTGSDWELRFIDVNDYQLIKGYGSGGSAISLGLPYRNLYKPVAGSVVIALNGTDLPEDNWVVDTATGRVSFVQLAFVITAITKAANAKLTIPGHSFTLGMSIYIDTVVGMVEINSQRAIVIGVGVGEVTVDINSTLYSNYVSGGIAITEPQPSETITGGCYFNIPCRFNSKVEVSSISAHVRDCGSIEILELLNP